MTSVTTVGIRTIAAGAAILLATAGTLSGEGAGRYRDFQLGTSVASVMALSGAATSDGKVIHQRPALIQELRWSPAYTRNVPRAAGLGDALQQIVFSFCDDQLFKLMIDYDRQRTLGMTDADMIDAVSQIYGAPASPKVPPATIAAHDEVTASRTVARWTDGTYSATLSRWAYGAAFRLTVESIPLAALARTADAQALILDARDAPLLEAARVKQEEQNRRDAQEKARATNKATFQP